MDRGVFRIEHSIDQLLEFRSHRPAVEVSYHAIHESVLERGRPEGGLEGLGHTARAQPGRSAFGKIEMLTWNACISGCGKVVDVRDHFQHRLRVNSYSAACCVCQTAQRTTSAMRGDNVGKCSTGGVTSCFQALEVRMVRRKKITHMGGLFLKTIRMSYFLAAQYLLS
jgi:hypothetical protein